MYSYFKVPPYLLRLQESKRPLQRRHKRREKKQNKKRRIVPSESGPKERRTRRSEAWGKIRRPAGESVDWKKKKAVLLQRRTRRWMTQRDTVWFFLRQRKDEPGLGEQEVISWTPHRASRQTAVLTLHHQETLWFRLIRFGFLFWVWMLAERKRNIWLSDGERVEVFNVSSPRSPQSSSARTTNESGINSRATPNHPSLQ